jgi:copper chaperone
MIAYQVSDMTCGHCVSTITKAVAAVDKDAKVKIDLPSHRVEIEPAAAAPAQLRAAIEEAGFTPVPA